MTDFAFGIICSILQYLGKNCVVGGLKKFQLKADVLKLSKKAVNKHSSMMKTEKNQFQV